MLQGEHSAILPTFIKLRFVIKIFVLSILEWPLKTGFTIYLCYNFAMLIVHTRPKKMVYARVSDESWRMLMYS